MAKRKKLSAKQKQARAKASKRRRNKRYYVKQKIYKEIVKRAKKLIDAKAIHARSISSYKNFWHDIEHFQNPKTGKFESLNLKTSELEREAKQWLEAQVIITRRTARSGRENLMKKVRRSIALHESMIKTMASSTDAVAYIRHLADDQGSLSWKEYVDVVSLAACIIGGYVKVRESAKKGLHFNIVSQPTIDEFRYVSGNWRFARDFIRLKLGPNEEEAYGS